MKKKNNQSSSVSVHAFSFASIVCFILAGIFLIGGVLVLVGKSFSGLWQRTKSSSVNITPTPTVRPSPRVYTTQSGKRPQFVVLSFDGSQSIEMWQATRDFAKQMNQEGKPLHFTYFISGVYFVPQSAADRYHPPQHQSGQSAIGFADSETDIRERVQQVNAAAAEGHEIGSHANGHYDGSRWNEQEWLQELSQFQQLVFDWPVQLKPTEVIGFRAPLLAHNDAMYAALAKTGYRYDSSSVAPETLPTHLPKGWPRKEAHGIWLIPLNSVQLAGTRSSVLAMDYNFFLSQTHGSNIARNGTAYWQRLRKQMYDSYMNHFRASYAGERPPVIIGHHFSTWNDGVYWQAMRDVAKDVCGQPEVACVSFRELVEYLDAQK